MLRRFVIEDAELFQIVSILVVTLGCGVAGYGAAMMLAEHAGRNTDSAGSLGFAIGAAIGLVLSATAAAILFSLAETARNTRRMLLLLQERAAGPTRPGGLT